MIWLDRMPGINADEASYGVWAVQMLAGASIPWRTPNGTFLNPFYIFPQVIAELAFPREFFTLRLVALTSGVLALLFGWWSTRRRFGSVAGLTFLILAAALPMNIAYSRFGWDASQTFLFSMVVLHFAYGGRPVGTLVGLFALVLVHPMNVFLAPAVFLVFLVNHNWSRYRVLGRLSWAMIVAACGLLFGLGGLLLVNINPRIPWFVTTLLGSVGDRLMNQQHWLLYLDLYEKLITGPTVYRYIAGASMGRGALLVQSLVFWAAFVTSFVFGLYRARKSRNASLVVSMIAVPMLIVVGYLVHGPDALIPSHERYGAYLLAPTVLMFALAAGELSKSGLCPTRRITLVSSLVSCVLLWSFWQHYFTPLMTSGGHASVSMRTSVEEPKRLLAKHLTKLPQTRAMPLRVLFDSYWLSQPVRYLLMERESILLMLLSPQKESPFTSTDLERWLSEHDLLVGLVDDHFYVSMAAAGLANVRRDVIFDPAGRPVIYTWSLATKKEEIPTHRASP